MKTIGILITGHVPVELANEYGNYGDMFARLLGDFAFDFKRYFVVDGEFPDGPLAADGWLITGSKFGVYEHHDWIRRLEVFVRRTQKARVPMVGICFGHQVMAQALGGLVEKFDGGWAVGTTSYRRSDANEPLVLLSWHQDQVIRPPEGAQVIGSNDFCRHAMLRYGDWGLSYQPHPEFTPGYFERLAEVRRSVLPEPLYQSARTVRESLSTPRISYEIGEFLTRDRIGAP